ncbi:MAG: 4Fe-4S cluster-binding domain-containing protein [Anaerofustis sp.]
MTVCNLCPRSCGSDRPLIVSAENPGGICGVGTLAVLARAAVHEWEEPCISGKNGSGTVFFSGCPLKCCYCQNYSISTECFGQPVSIERLTKIYAELEAAGVHNINLVNPTHFTEAILQSFPQQKTIPFVYNSSGYDSVETLKRFDKKIDIYLPDLKYSDESLAWKYSRARNYFTIATSAIKEMFRQTGPFVMGENGLLKSGVLLRHLVLPSHIENTLRIIDWVDQHFETDDILFSLMFQYIPCGNSEQYPEINRRVNQEEYNLISDYLDQTKIENGYIQELDSAEETYIPSFDLTGITKQIGKDHHETYK